MPDEAAVKEALSILNNPELDPGVAVEAAKSILQDPFFDQLAEEWDEEDLLDAALEDRDEIPLEYRDWTLKEWVIAITGHRGSGKSLLMAFFLKNGLIQGKSIFTNLTMYPDKIGTDNTPRPIELQQLLSFDFTLNEAVVGIEELPTWLERKRAMATSNILVDKWLQQLRKRGLRVAFTQQSPYVPGGVLEQIDAIIYSHDVFFTPWGREAGVAKGTTFFYYVTDRSGAFTGQPGNTWGMALRQAHRLWKIYDTYQTQDPMQWARKAKIVGGEYIMDLDEGESYLASEARAHDEQKVLKEYNLLLTNYWRQWEPGFLKFARENGAITEDQPKKLVMSVSKLRTAITKLTGKSKKQFTNDYNELRALATSSPVARFTEAHRIIELAKPLEDNEQ